MTTLPDPPAATAPFSFGLRVYWEDTDAGGIVYYANYLRYFERARTEWLRALGVQQHELRERTGAIFVVTDVALRYLRPARLDDALQLTVELNDLRTATMRLRQQARRADALLCEGEIRIGCVDAASLQPRRIPPEVSRLL